EKDLCNGAVVPGGNCLLNVTFTPGGMGSRSASLVLTDNASDSPQSVALTGTAVDFQIGPQASGSLSATVLAGQTATYQLDLTSRGGFTGSVTVSCTGAPSGATCSSAPVTMSLPANGTAPFQINVPTTAQSPTARPLNSHSLPNLIPPSDVSASAARLSGCIA